MNLKEEIHGKNYSKLSSFNDDDNAIADCNEKPLFACLKLVVSVIDGYINVGTYRCPTTCRH